MPELPEVETIVRELRPLISGKVICRISVRDPFSVSDSPVPVESARGLEVKGVRRKGKYILADFAGSDLVLGVHLRMTGQLRWGNPDPRGRVWFEFRNCPEQLSFVDARRLGKVYVFPAEDLDTIVPPGLEPLEYDSEIFCRGLRLRKGRIKPLLMDQNFMAGLGNIYVTEALFDAGIKPTRRAGDLTRREGVRLLQSIQRCLETGIANGGSSLRNYVDLFGSPGRTQNLHRVYGRSQGSCCPRCAHRLRVIRMAQRGTVYCPGCQK